MPDARPRVVPSMIGMLHDVDVSTVPPVDGDAPIWDDGAKKWKPGGLRGGGILSGFRDRYVLSSSGAQSTTLTHEPDPYTEHVYLNGLEQDEGTDWTRSATTLSVLSAMGALSSDVLEVRYLYRPGGPAGGSILVPWEATGWKYKLETKPSSADYSAAAYDDSAWSTGQAAFGGASSGSVDSRIHTSWPTTTSGSPAYCWLRRSIGALPSGISTVTVNMRVDNYGKIYWNGDLIYPGTSDDYLSAAGGAPVSVVVPSADIDGTNVLAVRADSTAAGADVSFIDIQVVES